MKPWWETVPSDEAEKTTTEMMAERSDAWKSARAMLRQSDLRYTVEDVTKLADWLTDGMLLGDDE